MNPCVAPEKRPSVSSATESPRPWPDDRRGDREHLAHAGAARRALVADHDDVVRLDLLRLDRRERLLLGLEHARGAAVLEPPVARQLHDTAVGREVPAQDREAAVRLQRIGERADHLLALGLLGRVGLLADRGAAHRDRVLVQEAGLAQPVGDDAHSPGAEHVGRDEAPERLEVREQRRAPADPVEVVDRQLDAGVLAPPRAGAARRWSSRPSSRRSRSRSRTPPS